MISPEGNTASQLGPRGKLSLFRISGAFLYHLRRFTRGLLHTAPRDQSIDFSVRIPFASPLTESRLRVAAVIHIFNIEMTGSFIRIMNAADIAIDLFITTDTADKRRQIEEEMADFHGGKVLVRQVENRGRDVLPKLTAFVDEYGQYDVLLFLHSKKSTHFDQGADWANFLFTNLVGTPAHVRSVLAIFAVNPSVGIVFPQHFENLRRYLIWNTNFQAARQLATRMGFRLSARAPLDFPSGSMFWARPAALQPLISLGLEAEDFPHEAGQTEGTVAHSIERLYLHSAELAGFDWLKIADSSLYDHQDTIIEIDGPDCVSEFLQHHGLRLLKQSQISMPRRQT